MDSDQLFELFDQALDLESEEREQFLLSQDAQVAQELRQRIRSYEEECGFFDKNLVREYAPMLDENKEKEALLEDDSSPTRAKPLHNYKTFPGEEASTMPQLPRRSSTPDRIGPYPVIKKIGQGGMGSVYLVRQMNPEREVALKLINHSRVAPEFLARFEAEFGVLGLMNHNNIARIYYSSKTEEGDPYFTMEYVDGMPINKFCRDHNLTVRQRLELFRQVCEGVFHAHQKAVVHRDLKPSNILVTRDADRAVVKIIDFGIAKGLDTATTERTFETRTGVFVGTLDYMSPEQLGAGKEDVDTRSDIYSLGVLLYELLTGLLPFDKNMFASMSVDEMLRFYREEDPPRPSLRLKEGKDLAERTLTTEVTDLKTFVQQLHGDLDWVVMMALEKDSDRRYQTVAALKSDVMNYLHDMEVSARPPSMVYRVKKFTSRNRILVIAAALITLTMTVGVFTSIFSHFRTKEALQRYEASNKFLLTMLAEPDPQNAGIEARVVDVLINAEEGMANGLPDKELEATLRRTLGNTYRGLGAYEKATNLLQRSYELWAEVYGERHKETLKTRYELGRALRKNGEFEAATTHIQATWAIQREVFGEHHRDTLHSLFGLATIYFTQSEYQKSKEAYELVWNLQKDHLGEKDPDTVSSLSGLANCFTKLRDHESSLKIYQKVLAAQIEISGEASPEVLRIKKNITILYGNLGQAYKAEPLLRTLVESNAKLLGWKHPETISVQYTLAQCLKDLEKYTEAEELARYVLEFRRNNASSTDQKLHNAMNLMGEILGNSGKLEQGIDMLLELEALCEKKRPKLPYIWIKCEYQLGIFFLKAERNREALETFKRLFKELIAKYGPEHRDTLEVQVFLAKAYQVNGAHTDAEKTFLDLSFNLEKTLPDSRTPPCVFILAEGLRDYEHFLHAEALLVNRFQLARESGMNQQMKKIATSLETLYQAWQAEP